MTQPLIGNQAFDQAVGAIVVAVAGPLNAAKAHLGNTNIPLDRNTTLVTLAAQEGGFDGYAAKTVTWTGPFLNDQGQIEMIGMVAAAWTPSGAVLSTTIWNTWLTDSASAVLLLTGLIDGAPVPMASALNFLNVIYRYNPRTGGVTIDYF